MKRITTLQQLHHLALNRKAVIYGPYKRRVPAGFLINWPGAILLRCFQSGVYEYEKRRKECINTT